GRWLKAVPGAFDIRKTITETSAATFATLPLTVFFFGLISFIAPIANVLVLLIVPTLTWLGFFTALFATIPIVSPILTFITWAMSTAVLGFIEVLGSLSFAATEVGNLTILGAGLWSVFVLLLAWHLNQKST
ncbi:MAG: ComEC/Rec2 family competence protein, partial [bacterium]|nr:ComEC/Rec2 family competence protein [bacterium]